ncbi:hypothetical protein ACJRO7_006894 [Eucalyptus globulus]|uniref:Uncharacterized protein n=1 Tax=Eucalyptus globulus TaxID=34317 RepID=A0ABD3IMI9_EUCGL
MMQYLKLAASCPPSLRWSPSSALRPKPLSSSTSSPSSPPSRIEYTPWPGLRPWRESLLNHNRFWGPNGPQPPPGPALASPDPGRSAVGSASSLAEMGALVLSTGDPASKSELSHLAYCRWRGENLPVGVSRPPDRPARPARPELEARGLDAGPRLVQKLVGFGDNMTSKIVGRIADEEMAHVAVGVDWFISICQKMNHAPCSTFKDILTEYGVELKGPFNYSARDEAGIPRDWYASSSTNKQDGKEQLSVVYGRLAHIISMESENSSSSGPA